MVAFYFLQLELKQILTIVSGNIYLVIILKSLNDVSNFQSGPRNCLCSEQYACDITDEVLVDTITKLIR